jgi:hypothetical protein
MVQRTKNEASSHEIWKPVVGYEDLYEVSNFGRVRSLDRISSNGTRRKGRLLTPTGIKHLHVTLSRSGVKIQPYVHVLVLEAFLGLPKEGQIGCHKNDIPTDNHLSNLYWGTYSENFYDSVRNGIRTKAPGSKLCPSSVRTMRKLHREGLSMQKIALQFDVHPATVQAAISRRTWNHVK